MNWRNIYLIICLVITFLFFFLLREDVSASVLVSDDFDSYNSGYDINDDIKWFQHLTQPSLRVNDDESVSSPNSAGCWHWTTFGHNCASETDLISVDDLLSVSFFTKNKMTVSHAQSLSYITILNENSDSLFSIQTSNLNDEILIVDSTGSNVFLSDIGLNDNWYNYLIEIDFVAGLIRFSLPELSESTGFLIPANEFESVSISFHGLVRSGNNYYYDDIQIQSDSGFEIIPTEFSSSGSHITNVVRRYNEEVTSDYWEFAHQFYGYNISEFPFLGAYLYEDSSFTTLSATSTQPIVQDSCPDGANTIDHWYYSHLNPSSFWNGFAQEDCGSVGTLQIGNFSSSWVHWIADTSVGEKARYLRVGFCDDVYCTTGLKNYRNYIVKLDDSVAITTQSDAINQLFNPESDKWIQNLLNSTGVIRDIRGYMDSYRATLESRFPFSWISSIYSLFKEAEQDVQETQYPSLLITIPVTDASVDLFPIEKIMTEEMGGVSFSSHISYFKMLLTAVFFMIFIMGILYRTRKFIRSIATLES